MEGRYTVAGPWFTVLRSGDDWQTLETIWISNGTHTTHARVQSRLVLEPAYQEETP
ncbi:MAG: hypothetical protein KC910_27085 [Candidatus Eremiobacteraeota bacterium]|nr:hypothetical protein [Candidatus Eremiobacteraeota bacterium]